MSVPPYQSETFTLSPSLSPPLRTSPSQYSQMQSTYSLASVPRGIVGFGDYDYENYQSIDDPPQVENYGQNTQINNMYSGGADNFPYHSEAQTSETLSTYWQGVQVPPIIEASAHLPPLNNQFMRSTHLQNAHWPGNSSSSASTRPSTAGSNYSNYSQNYSNSPGSARSFSSFPQTSSSGRRSRSSELIPSPYSSHLSPPQTPNLMPADDALPNLDGHREQLRLFKAALTLPLSFHAGPFVPQKMYMPHTNSDRRRYVEEIDLQLPIYFWMESPDECGIPLVDALHSRVRRLKQRDEPVFEGRGPSISVRIQWPGYRPWSRQIPTKDFRSPPQPITKAKLAKNIAKCVERFLSARSNNSLEDDVDPRWKVGPRHHEIKLEDLYLVSMHHVSMGSWQPHLRLRRPLPQ